eukprot:6181416-Pyramimonas_sp.AAC.1
MDEGRAVRLHTEKNGSAITNHSDTGGVMVPSADDSRPIAVTLEVAGRVHQEAYPEDDTLAELIERACAQQGRRHVLLLGQVPLRVPHIRRMLKDRKLSAFLVTRPEQFELRETARGLGVQARCLVEGGDETSDGIEGDKELKRAEIRVAEIVRAAVEDYGVQTVCPISKAHRS